MDNHKDYLLSVILVHASTDIIIECFRINKVASTQASHIITVGTFFNPKGYTWEDINLYQGIIHAIMANTTTLN